MKKYLGGIILIVTAVIILSVGIILANYNTSKNYEKITGIISDIVVDEVYIPEENKTKTNITFYVNYNFNGKSYKDVRLDYSNSINKVGDKIDFYVNADNPDEITISPQSPLFICICLSAGFVIMGVIVIIRAKRSSVY